MLESVKTFLVSEDAVILGTGIGSILGGIVIALRAVRKGKPTPPALAAVEAISCKLPDVAPRLAGVEGKLGELLERINENDDAAIAREERAEQHRESISRIVTEILKLVIRLDERTQNKRG